MGATYSNETACPREFDCKRCGDRVYVDERSDHRTVFCCEHCEREYWRHRSRYDRRKKIGRGHVTLLCSEHLENRREQGFEG
nr:MAG TPA: LysW biosynthesis protein LysW [Caudoviricetes sp.]